MQYDLVQSLEILTRTPTVLAVLLDDLSREWLTGNEGAETWSPISVLAHLVHGERTDWITRARTIIEKGEDEVFVPFDRTAHLKAARTRSVTELLVEFRLLRQENIATLRGWNLTPTDLARTGQHPDFGRVTLGQLLSTWVVHDLGHIGQVARVMAKQYGSQVGPWQAYLPVLHR